MKLTLYLIAFLLWCDICFSAPMTFEANSTGGNACCWWIQASGDITAETPLTLRTFVANTRYAPNVIRLNSRGGNLAAGLLLGQTIRQLGLSTEVGTSGGDPKASEKKFGICASACAYAFLGGVERSLESDESLGFHRFYLQQAVQSPETKLFTGQDMDRTQQLTANLVAYTLQMGIDSNIVPLASQAGPHEVRWLSRAEAAALKVIHDPSLYKAWRVEPVANGAIAVSESNDGKRRIVAGCSRQTGPYVLIIDGSSDIDLNWLRQCIGGIPNHPVFGSNVSRSQISLLQGADGATIIRFRLPDDDPPLTSPELFSFSQGYFRACASGAYRASVENFVPAVRLALRNCTE